MLGFGSRHLFPQRFTLVLLALFCSLMVVRPLVLPLCLAQLDDVGLHVAEEDVRTCAYASQQGLGGPYSKVLNPTLNSAHLEDLPGFTRSVVERDHALITPESHVFSPLPGWTNTAAAYFITPAIGAHFSMFLAHMSGNATAAPPSPGVQRFLFVLTGEVTLTFESERVFLQEDSFAYLPANSEHSIQTECGAAVLFIEKMYTLSDEAFPKVLFGRTKEQPILPVPGEVFALRKLLPTTSAHDFNIHVMDFLPGEYLNVKEVHYNQHGLLLVEGRGIYRLADKWYPVQAGDVIWMAPFVPQWYAALGSTRSRYILYKDTNRDPVFHS